MLGVEDNVVKTGGKTEVTANGGGITGLRWTVNLHSGSPLLGWSSLKDPSSGTNRKADKDYVFGICYQLETDQRARYNLLQLQGTGKHRLQCGEIMGFYFMYSYKLLIAQLQQYKRKYLRHLKFPELPKFSVKADNLNIRPRKSGRSLHLVPRSNYQNCRRRWGRTR